MANMSHNMIKPHLLVSLLLSLLSIEFLLKAHTPPLTEAKSSKMSDAGTYVTPLLIACLVGIVVVCIYSRRRNPNRLTYRAAHQKPTPHISRQEWPRIESSWTTTRATNEDRSRPTGTNTDLERGPVDGDVLPKYSRTDQALSRPPPAYQP